MILSLSVAGPLLRGAGGVLNKTNNKTLMADFRATLQYKSTEEGGRYTPAKSGYCPTIKFSFEKGLFGGVQYFIGKGWVLPGETITADIYLIISGYFQNRLEEGMTFEFTEGARIIGTGIITKIINEKLRKQ